MCKAFHKVLEEDKRLKKAGCLLSMHLWSEQRDDIRKYNHRVKRFKRGK